MQRYLTSLLVMLLYLASSPSSAQQFESFRQVGEASGIAAGAVTGITLAQTLPTTGSQASEQTDSQISFFNAAGVSTVYDVIFTPSNIIRADTKVFLPPDDFSAAQPGPNLDEVSFFTALLVNAADPQGPVPTHWFRMTFYNGIWSGAFRIADRIYSIDRSRRDNIVEVRITPSPNITLRPTRQLKITALIDDEFVFADPPGDSIGLDSIGHIHALESLHIMEALTNDSLGMTFTLDQVVYRPSRELVSPGAWLESNASSFGIDDNFTSFFFRGNESLQSQVSRAPNTSFVVQNTLNFNQLTSAHLFGNLFEIRPENSTLQSNLNPLDAAHWSEAQRTALLDSISDFSMIQTISSDAPEIEITESEEIINQIPQDILDSEIVESIDQNINSNSDGLLQNDEINTADLATQSSGGGMLSVGSIGSLLSILLVCLFSRKRFPYT